MSEIARPVIFGWGAGVEGRSCHKLNEYGWLALLTGSKGEVRSTRTMLPWSNARIP
jgi:hypothetical protein